MDILVKINEGSRGKIIIGGVINGHTSENQSGHETVCSDKPTRIKQQMMKRNRATDEEKMKLLGLLHRHVFGIKKSRLGWRSFLTNSTFEQSLETIDIDRTIASVHSIYSNPCYSLLGICNTIGSLKKIHGLLIVEGLTDDLLCQTKLVSLYGFFRDVKCARSVFNQIRNPDLYSWKVMIRWYFLSDSYPELIRFYTHMKQCLKERDNVVFSVVLKACSELQDLYEGRKLHCEIVKFGNPDSFVLTGLVDVYAKCGEIRNSRTVFEEITERNVVSWTSMIAGYVQNDCPEEALVLFNRMRQGMIDANQVTMGSLLTACTKLGALNQGKWVHGFIIKEGIIMNSFLVTALLNMYVKCGMIADARAAFDELPIVDLVSWTAMIAGYAQRNYPDEALRLYTDKRWAGLLPNSVTIAGVLSACGQAGNSNLGRSVHGIGVKLGLEDGTVRNGLIDMYAKGRMIRDAYHVFQTVTDKDLIAWNSMITGFALNGYAHEAMILFHQMRLDSVSPDAVTVVGVLSACASVGALYLGCSLHAYALREGFLSSNVRLGTALLNFYAKCGDAGSARKVFDSMEEKNAVTWSAMMGGYGMHGDASESLALFAEMLSKNVEPNEVIFTSILSACSHTGMVGEGWRYFNSMCREYEFVPSMKHYVCMVDLLARAGRIEEALAFIETMPVQPDTSVFGAFLHGCRLHSRLDLGELGVKKMLQLEPSSAGYYVLISNFYAADRRWDKANEVRELMKHRGLSKSPGCSLVEMDRGNHISALRVASLS